MAKRKTAMAGALVASAALGAALHSATIPDGEPLAKTLHREYQISASSDYCKALDVFAGDTLGLDPSQGDISLRLDRPATSSVCYHASGGPNLNGQIEAGNELCAALDDMLASTLCDGGACKPEQLKGALRAARPATRSVCWMLSGDFALPGEWRPK